MISSICIISLLLQSIVSNFVSVTGSYLNPLFAVCALILIFPYFKESNKFLLTSFLYGISYDILFSEMLFMHALLFLLLGIVVMVMNHLWSNHLINNILFLLLIIPLYKVLYYFLLSIIDKIPWKSSMCLEMISRSLLMNLFYIVIAFLITDRISKKFGIRKNE